MSAPEQLSSKLMMMNAGGLGLLVVLTAGAYLVGAEPVLNARAEIQQQRALLESQARQAAEAEEKVLREQKRLADARAELARMEVPLYPASDLMRRLLTINGLSQGNELEVRQLEPGRPEPSSEATKFTEIPIRIAGSGTFPDVAGFLGELLGMAYRDVEVRAMILNAPDKDGNKGSFEMDLRWFAAPTVAGAGGTGAGSAAGATSAASADAANAK